MIHKFSRYLLTLVALFAISTGAWAQTVTVTWTLADLEANPDVTTFTKDGVTIKCGDRLSSGKSFNGPVTISTTLGNFTKIEITGSGNAPTTADGFTNDGNVSTWTGNAASISTGAAIAYATQFVFTIAPAEAPITVDWNASTKTGTFSMPGGDVVLTPIYAPDAQFAIENAGTDNEKVLVPAPVEGLCAGSGEPIMTAGTTNEGTLYYTVTETDDIPAFSTTTWTTTLPTAEAFTTPCTVYGWAYIVGDDTHNDNGVFGPYAITLKRDLFDRVSAVLNNGSRVRLIMNEGKYQPIEPLTYTLTDISDAENPKTLVSGTDYTYGGMQMMNANNQWEDVTDESNLPPGIYRAQFYGMGDFAGWKPTDSVFELYYGYEVVVPAQEYITYYSAEPVRVDQTEQPFAEIYTISEVGETTATLSGPLDAMKANKPMLVYNNSTETQNILLIPCNEPDVLLSVAPEFKGTLEATEIPASSETADYYVCTGNAFVWVKSAGTIGANKCWLEISNQPVSARRKARSIVYGDGTTGIDASLVNSEERIVNSDVYDLNGRKVQNPTKKGIYIKNGKKVVIK